MRMVKSIGVVVLVVAAVSGKVGAAAQADCSMYYADGTGNASVRLSSGGFGIGYAVSMPTPIPRTTIVADFKSDLIRQGRVGVYGRLAAIYQSKQLCAGVGVGIDFDLGPADFYVELLRKARSGDTSNSVMAGIRFRFL